MSGTGRELKPDRFAFCALKLQYGVFTENHKFVCTNNVKMQLDKREKLFRTSWYLF